MRYRILLNSTATSELMYLLQVGQALAETKVPRKDLWLTSKLWNSYHSPELVEPVLDETLESLGVSYLDLYLYILFSRQRLQKGKTDSRGALQDALACRLRSST